MICQVRAKKTNANEPLMRCRYVYMLSKLGNRSIPEISSDVIWIRAEWQPVWRRRDFSAGFNREHENLSL